MSEIIGKLHDLGQSLWYDNIQRKLIENGKLDVLIKRGDIRGVTSNPSIFHNAIAKSNDYDSALIPLALGGWDAESIFWQLAIEDIQNACDLFLQLYEDTNGEDGYVSIEVSPYLANKTDETIQQARVLWERVDRPNLMIKIPATIEGIPAIRETIAGGINVNVTLIFSLRRYDQIIEAYLLGLEDRVTEGLPVDQIASVASFFVSRVDTKVDALLPQDSILRGQAAISNARLAYQAFKDTFSGERWETLRSKGARLQRPLWASTSTKNPDYPDTVYVDTLIGEHTVNTVPPNTLDAFRDHGKVTKSISRDMEHVRSLFGQLEAEGVDMDKVTQELEQEGVAAFADAYTALLDAIQQRCDSAVAQIGTLAPAVARRISQLENDSFVQRMWDHDPTLWETDPEAQVEINQRLGWLTLPITSSEIEKELREFAESIHYEGILRVLLIGMGGSSLAPEVFSFVFADNEFEAAEGKPCLSILDSTDPVQVAQAARDYPPDESLYIISSKSGGTVEVLAALEYFWDLSSGDGSRFVAVSDPGTPLEKLALERGFRKVFNADPDVGGRYSALSVFGLLPAALLGLDIKRLLSRGAWMMDQSGPHLPLPRNPGLVLGTVIAEAALSGRDKLTILADSQLVTLGSWLEQLIAESSGKNGIGIIPIDREPPGQVSDYGNDRIFVYLRQDGEYDRAVLDLRKAKYPVLEIAFSDLYDLAAEVYRWEIASAVACHILGVNAFNQPDVEDAKVRARDQIAAYQKEGVLAEGEFVPLKQAKQPLSDFIKLTGETDYFSIAAFLPRNSQTVADLQDLRLAIRNVTKAAVSLGFGPRFLHSTGQLHKGGPNTGLFLQITADASNDFEIPTQGMSFGTLELAQALGDYEALQARDRRILRIHLSRSDEVNDLKKMIEKLG